MGKLLAKRHVLVFKMSFERNVHNIHITFSYIFYTEFRDLDMRWNELKFEKMTYLNKLNSLFNCYSNLGVKKYGYWIQSTLCHWEYLWVSFITSRWRDAKQDSLRLAPNSQMCSLCLLNSPPPIFWEGKKPQKSLGSRTWKRAGMKFREKATRSVD